MSYNHVRNIYQINHKCDCNNKYAVFDFTNIPDYATAARAWLYRMHQDMYHECSTWKQYTDNATTMERLLEQLERGELTDNGRDELYNAINEYQLMAADIAYAIGVKHGIAAQKAVADGGEMLDFVKQLR